MSHKRDFFLDFLRVLPHLFSAKFRSFTICLEVHDTQVRLLPTLLQNLPPLHFKLKNITYMPIPPTDLRQFYTVQYTV